MTEISRRQLGQHVGRAALGLGLLGLPFASAAAQDSAKPFDITPYVHPELRAMVPMLMPMSADVPTRETLPKHRRDALGFSFPPLASPTWSERRIGGPVGAPDLRIFIVNAKSDGSERPAILHIHGGGFITGSAQTGLRALQDVALALDCVIVSVDYRLAPETRFPGSLEDNYAALKWLYQNAREIGVDSRRIAVMGESAGGGHAAMLAIAARDRGEVPLVYQALIYPMLDDRTGSTRRKPPYMGALIWTEAHNRFGWSSLLGAAGARKVPPGSVPARVDNLRGLPPAFIGVGSIDLFADEDVEYAQRLMDSGVATELHVVPGAFHGFDVIPGTTIGPEFRADLTAALRRAFQTAP